MAEFAAIAERSPDAMYLRGADGHVAYANSAAQGLVGAGAAGIEFRESLRVAGDVDPVLRALGAGGVWTGDSVLRHVRSGADIPVWVSAFVVTGRHARTPVVAVVARDLRGRFDVECRLREAVADAAAHAREQRTVADLSRTALTAGRSRILAEATEAAAALAGMDCAVVFEPSAPDRSELLAVSYSGPSAPPSAIPLSRLSHAGLALRSDAPVTCADRDTETRFPTDFMVARGVRSGAAVVIEGSDEPWGVLAVYSAESGEFSDGELAYLQTVAGVVSAAMRRQDLETELRRRIAHDPLTGLANRVLVRQRIADVRVHGNPCPIAVLVVDLDNFKMINDTLGHAVGDRALQFVATLLADAVDQGDIVSRFGGDEFVVLHLGPDPVGVAMRILEGLAVSFGIDGFDITVAASIGIAVDENYTADADDLFRRADSAMYTAKKSRTTGYAVHGHSDPRHGSAPRSHIQHDLEFEQ
ncbi:sensor domain-containing diguanylate cyclase [Rhodococcus sp. 14-2470-1a]|uniref:sensor domain-containing diguanylate cyclase n=1 Tax=Rhodococcus sp. 14-2470-1a TaxID=2023150 RepID=UPI000B9B02EB|nr:MULTISPECIES: sensor domain-containing diguanylate cyclase [unclassified Rhodococcus (in: high G+C Gram-positive bacteria)]OZF06223.1 sensor domain-containing diguanylate cyclase [Rhodococcus sp. 15-1154-1]OZF48766.1 sensor domain-containing diguanylate cyclase [Rhodococcus sp. 14-2470-1a]